MGLAQSGVMGAFLAQDLALFVVFFDLMLVPFYFLTLVWGTDPEKRGPAVLKLFIYTLVGSLLMLVGAIATGVLAGKGQGDVDVRPERSARTSHLVRLAGLDLPRLRARLPDQDAVVPVPRLDARRVRADADRAARRLHRDPVEGRRLRLPA